MRVCGSFYRATVSLLHPRRPNKSKRWRISRRSGKVGHSFCQSRRCKKANVLQNALPVISNAKINATAWTFLYPAKIITRPPYRGSTGNSAFGGITLPISLHCGEFGDSCNPVTKKTRRGSFGNRRPLASPRQWPELGPSFAKTNGPSFQGAYCTERRNVKSVVPRFLGCAHILVVAGSRPCCRRFASPVSFDPFQYARLD